MCENNNNNNNNNSNVDFETSRNIFCKNCILCKTTCVRVCDARARFVCIRIFFPFVFTSTKPDLTVEKKNKILLVHRAKTNVSVLCEKWITFLRTHTIPVYRTRFSPVPPPVCMRLLRFMILLYYNNGIECHLIRPDVVKTRHLILWDIAGLRHDIKISRLGPPPYRHYLWAGSYIQIMTARYISLTIYSVVSPRLIL